MKTRGYCQRLKVYLGAWKFLHKATSRFCSQCQLGFQRHTSKKRYLQMTKKWLNTRCSHRIYTFHLGMFRKSSATPTRKDIGAGGAVWTDIATHVFNNTKHLFKSSMIKLVWYDIPSTQFFCKMSILVTKTKILNFRIFRLPKGNPKIVFFKIFNFHTKLL